MKKQKNTEKICKIGIPMFHVREEELPQYLSLFLEFEHNLKQLIINSGSFVILQDDYLSKPEAYTHKQYGLENLDRLGRVFVTEYNSELENEE